MAEEKAKKPRKPRAKKKKQFEPKPQTNHTLKELCAQGQKVRRAHMDLVEARFLHSIGRPDAPSRDDAEKELNYERQQLEKLHNEYMEQKGADKDFALRHHKSMPDA